MTEKEKCVILDERSEEESKERFFVALRMPEKEKCVILDERSEEESKERFFVALRMTRSVYHSSLLRTRHEIMQLVIPHLMRKIFPATKIYPPHNFLTL
jgi:hypothetical protein